MRRWMALLAASALLALSGCGLFGGGEDAAPGLLETAAGLSAPCAVAEADGVSIGSRSYLYWLGRNCAYLAEALTAQGREVQWNQGSQGETLGDAAKSAALRTAALYALLPKLAEEAGLLWEDADEAALHEARQAKIAALGGEDAWAAHLARWGLSETDAEVFARCHRLYARLYEESRREGSSAYLSPEDIAAYAEKQGLQTAAVLAVADSAQAEAIVSQYGIRLSAEAAAVLAQETPKALDNVETQITGSVRELCRAAADVCRQLGYEPVVLTDSLTCQAREAGSFLASIARYHQNSARSLAFLAGGETVVKLTGAGKGGRNQEIALAAAEGIAGLRDTAVFSVGSDGTDGPTDAAGGFVTGETRGQLEEKGVSIFQVLQDNDAYNALAACDGLIVTGATGTNVNDVAIALIRR